MMFICLPVLNIWQNHVCSHACMYFFFPTNGYILNKLYLKWSFCKLLNQILNHYFWVSDPVHTVLHTRSSLEKPCVVPMHNAIQNSQSRIFFQRLANGERHISSQTKSKRTLVSCAKTTEPIKTTKSDGKLVLS